MFVLSPPGLCLHAVNVFTTPPALPNARKSYLLFILFIYLFLFFFAGPPGDRGRERSSSLDLAEQRIIVSGVGLAVGSHGEEGRSAVYLSL